MGKNKTRLQQNNTDLQAIKVTVEGLPVLPTPQVVTIDGVQHSENLAFESVLGVTALPYMSAPNKMIYGSAVVLNNEIHVLGSYEGAYSSGTNHYKFNGTSWVQVSTLPYGFGHGSAVVLNGEIHILGGYYDSNTLTKHYKFNGTSWTEVSTLPYGFGFGSAIVLNNEIHILGGNSSLTKHYKFNGTSWTSVSTLPYSFYDGSAVVLNGEIHILGGKSGVSSADHYKFNGTSWTSVSTLPINSVGAQRFTVLENGIHYYTGGSQAIMDVYKFENGGWSLLMNHASYVGYTNRPAVVRINEDDYVLGSSNNIDFIKIGKVYKLAS